MQVLLLYGKLQFRVLPEHSIFEAEKKQQQIITHHIVISYKSVCVQAGQVKQTDGREQI